MKDFIDIHIIGIARELSKSLPVSKRSSKGRKTRNLYLKENPVCVICGRKKQLQIHHIKPFRLYPELELDFNNLITLCSDHHFLFGHLRYWKSYNVNIISDVIYGKNKIENRPV